MGWRSSSARSLGSVSHVSGRVQGCVWAAGPDEERGNEGKDAEHGLVLGVGDTENLGGVRERSTRRARRRKFREELVGGK